MAEAAVTFLLEQVTEVVKGHKDLISGAENEFNQLNNELGYLKAFLKDAATKSKQEHLFKELERNIRDVVYEVEDTIDTCLTKAIEAKAKAKTSRKPNFMNSKRFSLAKEVKSIREEKVQPILKDAKLRFGSMQIADGSGPAEDPRNNKLKRDIPIRQERVVGFEDEEATITEYLMQENQRLDIIPIIGIPGQGKTTLTWKIYQKESICFQFPIRIWVYISQKFNSRDVFLQILRKFAPSQDTSKLEYDDLVETIKESKTTGALEPPVSEVHKFHRLCFRSDLSKFLHETPNGPHVRSFLCFYKQPFELEQRYIAVIPDGFQKLRILESKSIKFHQFPAKVTKLIHLRYLTLQIDTLTALPKLISQLWNLQTLVVETKSRTITMEANMWKMVSLRHVKTRAAILLNNEWEGEAGQNLQTLDRLSPKSCTEAVSKRAKNLKTLGVSGKLTTVFKTKFLEELHHLEKLKLVNSVTYEPTSEDRLHRLPQSNCFPRNLKRLTLMNTFLDWLDMSILAKIHSLEALKLKDNAFVGLSWKVSGYNFPSLQLLLIVNTDLVLWDAFTDSFPSLRFLVVRNCADLIEIPKCLGTHLEKLDIERLRDSAVESAKAIGETKKGKPQGKFAVPFVLNIGPVSETK
ncbi:hypothetical protein C2S52_005215 [Perilla frutescens var. hirtella]|nr:hypothetical protein C2S52_005215 [Perilla frutescens var. hirtella]